MMVSMGEREFQGPTISATILTKDNEGTIERCLKSLSWVHEIVVVDSFSTDSTVEIAKRYTQKVIQRPWCGFVRQRNFSKEQASGTWILWVDSDEVVSQELKEEILEAVRKAPPDVGGFEIPRLTFYLGRWIRHGSWFPDYSLRLFRREGSRWVGEELHEVVEVTGRTERLKNPLMHYTYGSFGEQIRTIDRYSSLAARALYKRGERFSLRRMLLHPIGRFLKEYLLKRGFMDGLPGLIITVSTMFYVFSKYGKLWELERAKWEDRDEGGPCDRQV
jgi:glycosyltransferase involved in cell wall biosynthesis